MSHYEELARELESIHDRREELKPLIAHVRDDTYSKEALVQELLDARLGFFAFKLNSNYYDTAAAEFAKHLTQQEADKQTENLAKQSAEQAAIDSEKKEKAPVSTEPQAAPASSVSQNPQQTPEAATTPKDAPVETAPDADKTPPDVEEKPLPQCPSCAGFHVSFTQEHPFKIPDQSA